jgi:putative ABC transport system substrate-binding protein
LLCLGTGGTSYSEAPAPGKIPRVGFLLNMTAPSAGKSVPIHDGFVEGMRERGYVDGKNVIIEKRWAEGRLDRLPDLVADLVRQRVDVLVVGGQQGLDAARRAGGTIPTVVVACDPLEALVGSLARPGGTMTGLTCISSELAGKRLELLKEIVPGLTRVAIAYNPSDVNKEIELRELHTYAKALGLALQPTPMARESGFEQEFRAMRRGNAQAVVVLADPLFNFHAARLSALATQFRIPAIFGFDTYVVAGGLMSYGASLFEMNRGAADYVDRILKGTPPGSLPIQQPTRFELVINAKTAKTLGVRIPQSILLRTDRVIE